MLSSDLLTPQDRAWLKSSKESVGIEEANTNKYNVDRVTVKTEQLIDINSLFCKDSKTTIASSQANGLKASSLSQVLRSQSSLGQNNSRFRKSRRCSALPRIESAGWNEAKDLSRKSIEHKKLDGPSQHFLSSQDLKNSSVRDIALKDLTQVNEVKRVNVETKFHEAAVCSCFGFWRSFKH
ncbi:hypothetical protein BC829DRAFT_389986 [Chytridium lagenaria]|nr:hypothetical protein BC829DRAFT_389986 [Chytridium lagenaria]